MLTLQDLLNPWPTPSSDAPHLPAPNSTVCPTTAQCITVAAGSDIRSHSSKPYTPASPRSCTPPHLPYPSPTHHNVRVRSPLETPPVISPPRSHTSSPALHHILSVKHEVHLNQKTVLQTLYHYPPGTMVEYPETSAEGCIGHLFEVAPDNWYNPRLNFAYSQGAPTGRTKVGEHVSCALLVDEDGNEVPCREVHSTCMFHEIIL